MKSPLVSVLIPAYKHEKYIQETISSIIAQTYKNIELLIIDDGSSDTTYDRICDMETLCKKRFEKFDFLRHKNMGIIDTLNKLIKMAQGEFVYIIASDDIAAPHAIETELNFLVNNPDYALCVGNNDIIDENSKRCFWKNDYVNTNNITDAKFYSFTDNLMKNLKHIDFYSDEFGSYDNLTKYGNHVPNGYLIRKSIFKKTGLYIKEAPLEDYYIMMQIAKYAKMKYLNDTLFYYRIHNKNTINNSFKFDATYKTLLYECPKSPLLKKLKPHCVNIQ